MTSTHAECSDDDNNIGNHNGDDVDFDEELYNAKRKEVASWLHNEKRCVTARLICVEGEVDHSMATRILMSFLFPCCAEEGGGGGGERQYQVVYYGSGCKVQDKKETCLQLRSKLMKAPLSSHTVLQGELYSLAAPAATTDGSILAPTIASAQESVMVLLRQKDGVDPPKPSSMAVVPTRHNERAAVKRLDAATVRQARNARMNQTGAAATAASRTNSNTKTTTAPSAKKPVRKSGSTTTAAAFFPKRGNASAATLTPAPTTTKKPSGLLTKRSQNQETPVAEQPKEKVPRRRSVAEEEKENRQLTKEAAANSGVEKDKKALEKNKAKTPTTRGSVSRTKKANTRKEDVSKQEEEEPASTPVAKRGNVDDFVGDVEEDDEEEEADSTASKREESAPARRSSRSRSRADKDNDDAAAEKTVPSSRSKKRRSTSKEAPPETPVQEEEEEEGDDTAYDCHGGNGKSTTKSKKKTPVVPAGAMNAYVVDNQNKPSQPEVGGTKRRRVLKRKFFTNPDGSFRVEQVMEWETVEEEEQGDLESEKPSKRDSSSRHTNGTTPSSSKANGPSASKSNTATGRKQQGLFGFFQKKA